MDPLLYLDSEMARLRGTVPNPSGSQVPYPLENDDAQLNYAAAPSKPPRPEILSSSTEDELSSEESHVCDECGKRYSKLHKLTKHYRNHFPCLICPHDLCEKRCPEKKDLDRHIRAHHAAWAKKNPRLAKLSTSVAEYRCTLRNCDYTTDRKDNLKRHIDKGACQRKRK